MSAEPFLHYVEVEVKVPPSIPYSQVILPQLLSSCAAGSLLFIFVHLVPQSQLTLSELLLNSFFGL